MQISCSKLRRLLHLLVQFRYNLTFFSAPQLIAKAPLSALYLWLFFFFFSLSVKCCWELPETQLWHRSIWILGLGSVPSCLSSPSISTTLYQVCTFFTALLVAMARGAKFQSDSFGRLDRIFFLSALFMLLASTVFSPTITQNFFPRQKGWRPLPSPVSQLV